MAAARGFAASRLPLLLRAAPVAGAASSAACGALAAARGSSLRIALAESGGLAAAASASAALGAAGRGKRYPLEQQSLVSWASPRLLALSLARASLLELRPLFEQWIDAVERQARELEQDEGAVTPPLPRFPDVRGVLPGVAALCAREWATVSLRRVYERAAAALLSERAAWKMIKDAPASAVRKAARAGAGAGRGAAAARVLRTAAAAQVLAVAAGATMQQLLDTYALLRSGRPRGERRRAYALRTLCNLLVAAAELGGAACGAALGTALRPGRGTFFGLVLGGMGAAQGVQVLCHRALAGPPPAAGDANAGGAVEGGEHGNGTVQDDDGSEESFTEGGDSPLPFDPLGAGRM